jgi:hypothetical protein
MQVRLIKELYGNQIKELYHSLPYHMVEFVLDDSEWLVHFLVFAPTYSVKSLERSHALLFYFSFFSFKLLFYCTQLVVLLLSKIL